MRRILIIGVVLALVLSFMMTYVVRFNEQAVVSTLGKADEGSVVRQPGLHFRWPYPFQKVTVYDTRLRLIQSDQETQQTKDKSQVILQTYLVWRVNDALKFYQRFSGAGSGEAGGSGSDNPRDHYKEAERIVKARLRSATAAVSGFRSDELLSPSENASKLESLERAMLERLENPAQGETSLSDYGIALGPEAAPGATGEAKVASLAKAVGVSGMGFPQDTTRAVFERMKKGRSAIANQTLTQGEAEATAIRSRAESDAKKIAAFADAMATDIRNQGEIEAAGYLRQMQEDPRLAIFLQNMAFYRRGFGSRVTFVLSTSMPGMELMNPGGRRLFQDGRPPAPTINRMLDPEALPVPRTEAPAPAEKDDRIAGQPGAPVPAAPAAAAPASGKGE